MARLEQQLALVYELDKLKGVLRQTKIACANLRQENSAEHSWQVAVMALLLAEHANEAVDISRVVKMLLIHDVVEIDAGDVIVYDEAAQAEQAIKEQAAAKRLFAMLPSEQGSELLQLWHEFEAAESAEAKFAKAMDRFLPMWLNYHQQGGSWQAHGIRASQVASMKKRIEPGCQVLSDKVDVIIETALENGWLKP
ncbi:HD domain-containing protein [Vibrio stylophorae]|uniref:HD domain-containing protein n=1 Tax=Vibrio stylophorae TaxID=659351 RepID=UPI001F1A13D5|nr:HD domain-containing protein [Vibrio stylophorae]